MAGAWRPAVVAMIGVLFVYGLRLPTAAVAAAVVIRASRQGADPAMAAAVRPSTLGFRAAISMLREIVTASPITPTPITGSVCDSQSGDQQVDSDL